MRRTTHLSDLHAMASRFASRDLMLCTSQIYRPILIGMTSSARPAKNCTGRTRPVDAARVEEALVKVSKLVVEDAAFTPIFERLEAELAAAVKEETRLSEAQRRARAFLGHKAMPRTNSARCSNDAPLPYRSRSRR